jgi:hypothetical protein
MGALYCTNKDLWFDKACLNLIRNAAYAFYVILTFLADELNTVFVKDMLK